MTKSTVLIILVTCLIACNNSKMQENLTGTWEATSLLANGSEMIPEVMKYAQFEFTADGKFINTNSVNTVTTNYTIKGNEIHIDGDTPLIMMLISELSETSLILNYTSGDLDIIAKFKRK